MSRHGLGAVAECGQYRGQVDQVGTDPSLGLLVGWAAVRPQESVAQLPDLEAPEVERSCLLGRGRAEAEPEPEQIDQVVQFGSGLRVPDRPEGRIERQRSRGRRSGSGRREARPRCRACVASGYWCLFRCPRALGQSGVDLSISTVGSERPATDDRRDRRDEHGEPQRGRARASPGAAAATSASARPGCGWPRRAGAGRSGGAAGRGRARRRRGSGPIGIVGQALPDDVREARRDPGVAARSGRAAPGRLGGRVAAERLVEQQAERVDVGAAIDRGRRRRRRGGPPPSRRAARATGSRAFRPADRGGRSRHRRAPAPGGSRGASAGRRRRSGRWTA